MLTINNKYNIGDKVYLLELKPIKYDCPVCDGKGVFNHNEYDVKCPKCSGTGKIEDKYNRLYSVKDGVQTITGIRTSTSEVFGWVESEYVCTGTQTNIRYNTTGGKRAEDRIYATLDEAVNACQMLNKKM